MSAPPASTAEAITPIGPIASTIAGSSTIERKANEYGSCAATGWIADSARASAIFSGVQFTTPQARTLPACTKPTTASTTSCMGTSGGAGRSR